MSLKERITDDMKAAMRAGEKERLGVIRMITAAIKQREVDERISLDDGQVVAFHPFAASRFGPAVKFFAELIVVGDFGHALPCRNNSFAYRIRFRSPGRVEKPQVHFALLSASKDPRYRART